MPPVLKNLIPHLKNESVIPLQAEFEKF